MKIRFLVPALIWLGIIIWLLSLPGNSIPKTPFLNIPHFDKIAHMGLFGTFVLLSSYGFFKQPIYWMQKNYIFITLGIVLILGAGTELMQYYLQIGRTASFADVLADMAGWFFGMIFFELWKRFYPSFLLQST